LIAAAVLHQAVVVTQERRSGGPPAVEIPDVCPHFGVAWVPLLKVINSNANRPFAAVRDTGFALGEVPDGLTRLNSVG